MTTPWLIVEIGFSSPSTGSYLHLGDQERGLLGINTLAPSTLLVDVTQWVASVSIRRGATRADGPTLRYEAGTATIVLRNEDRRFDPTNLAGPYVASGVTQVEPMRVVRVRATDGEQTWPLFRGFADNWQVNYTGSTVSTVTLTCSDAFMAFASYDRGAQVPVGAGEDAGARVSRILDSVSWPAMDRVIDTGDTTVQATALAANTLTELLLTADSEMGELFMDPDGRVVFRRRLAVQEEQRSAFPQVAFGDDPADGDTTINLTPNPSVETNTTGWRATGSVAPTLARSTAQALYGTSSLLVTWGAGGSLPGVAYDFTGLTVGETYTISMYVYVPSGSPGIALISSSVWGDTTSLTDQWVRLSWTGTATATTRAIGIWPVTSPAAGQQVYIDGLQLEEGVAATAYCDGDQPDCEWDGVPHASTSRRLPELPYADVDVVNDAASIYNLFLISNAGGTQQTVERAASRTAYLTRSYSRSDLLLQSDAAAKVYGEVLRAQNSTPELRFGSMKLRPRRDDRLWAQALGRQFGDRLRVFRRPPGGGAVIQRDVYLRGVTHDINPGGDWTTEFVLQAAPDIERVVDTFTRTVSSSWGTSDSGHQWLVDASPDANYSTNGTTGRIALSALNSERRIILDLGHEGQDVTVQCLLPITPTGAAINWGVVARRQDANNFFWIDAQVGIDSSITLRLIKRVATVTTQITTAASGVVHSTSVARMLRVRVLGTRVQAKLWAAGGTEPSTWQLSTTDVDLATGTSVGVIARLMTGNTNTQPVTFTFDNFTATSLHTWV